MSVATIAGYAEQMIDFGLVEGEHRILWKEAHRCFATRRDADFRSLTEADIEELTDYETTDKEVLMALPDMQAMVVARPPCALQCIERRRPIICCIDDMAQILGRRAEVVADSEARIARALKRCAGVMVRGAARTGPEGEAGGSGGPAKAAAHAPGPDDRALTVGRNPYEAYVAMTVLEKNARVTLLSDLLGGGIPVDPVVARLERLIYLRKYSRQEKERKDAEK